MCQTALQVKGGTAFYPALYSKAIQDAVRPFGFTEKNTKVTVEMVYKGKTYKKGHFLVTGNTDLLEFGEVVLILIKDDTAHFLVSVHITEFLPNSVRKDTEKMLCLNINALADFYPLTSYMKDGCQLIPLKHSVLSD